jgi:hypothetical protein
VIPMGDGENSAIEDLKKLQNMKERAKDEITAYFTFESQVYNAFNLACSSALDHFTRVIIVETKAEVEELRKEIEKENSDTTTGAFLFDLAVALITQTFLGHVTMMTLKNHYARTIRLRESLEVIQSGAGRSKPKAGLPLTVDFNKISESLVTRLDKGQRIQSMDEIHDKSKYFKYCTGFFNDAMQLIGAEFSKRYGINSPTSSDLTLDKIYGEPDRITNILVTKMGKISLLQDQISKYAIIQQGISTRVMLAFKNMVNEISDKVVLERFASFFNQGWRSLASDEKYDDLRLMFEAIAWIYYLGNPQTWASSVHTQWAPGRAFNEWSRERPGPYNLKTDESNIEKYEFKRRGDWVGNWGPYSKKPLGLVPVKRLNVRIPMVLFDYLIDEFLLDHKNRKSFASLAKGKELSEIAKQTPPAEDWPIPDESSRNEAGKNMIDWFITVNTALRESENEFSKLPGIARKIGSRNFSLKKK